MHVELYCIWKVIQLVIDSFTKEIKVSNNAIEFKFNSYRCTWVR